MMTRPAFGIFVIALVFCSCDSSEPQQMKTDPQPYAVEFFEIVTDPDTALVFYFNREVNSLDVPMVVYPIRYHDSAEHRTHHGITAIELPILESKNRKVIYPFPLEEKIEGLDVLNKTWEMVHFQDTINLYARGKRRLDRLTIIPKGKNNAPNQAVDANGNRMYFWYDHFQRFSKEIADSWSGNYLKRYKGNYNDKKEKSGEWKWFYSNGNLLAETSYNADTLVAPVKLFGYSGAYLGYFDMKGNLIKATSAN